MQHSPQTSSRETQPQRTTKSRPRQRVQVRNRAIALTTDVVLFGVVDQKLHVVLIRRANEPYADTWALPGGFVNPDERLEAAALRELEEETGVRGVQVEQLYTFGDPKRDPRGRTVSTVYMALASTRLDNLRAGDDAAEARLFPVRSKTALAFDHRRIINFAIDTLKERCWSVHGAWKILKLLLPYHFTLTELQETYEAIIECKVDKRNFRRKALRSGYLVATENYQENVRHRPARLYRLSASKQK